MRPQILTSAAFSLSRFSSTSATSNLAFKSLAAATCPSYKLFTPSVCQPAYVSSPAQKRFQSNMATNANAFLELVKNRRTYYALNKELTVSKERIQEIVKEAILHTPSSFNSQSNRILVLFGAEHDKLWGFATDILKAIVPADAWEHTAQRMNMFKGAAGTVCLSPFMLPVRNCEVEC